MTAKPSRGWPSPTESSAPARARAQGKKNPARAQRLSLSPREAPLSLKVRGDAVFFPIAVAGRVGSRLASDLLGHWRDGGPFERLAPALLGFGKGTLRLWRQTLRRGFARTVMVLAHLKKTCSAGGPTPAPKQGLQGSGRGLWSLDIISLDIFGFGSGLPPAQNWPRSGPDLARTLPAHHINTPTGVRLGRSAEPTSQPT
jgi:hypothetical protein